MAQSSLLPPENVRGMTTLDKSKFSKQIRVPVLQIDDSSMSLTMCLLKSFLLKLEKFKPVQVHETNVKEKVVFLNPDRIINFESFSNNVKMVLKEKRITPKNLQYRTITCTYDNWKYHEIISAILPPDLKFSGFSTIGHIIQLNLKEGLLPYKQIIGKVLHDKVKSCDCVILKVKNIENRFRNFELELLAGVDDLKTEVKENGCRFELNFAEVYWNPRLNDEHGRIISKLSEGDVLYDIFCGIGPFAIPAARVGCQVMANDLNPKCCEWLQRNMVINRVSSNQLQIFNKSGDVFIKQNIREDLLKRVIDPKFVTSKFHITMNLPASAHIFLPSFIGLFNDDELSMFRSNQLPIVHFYCFIKNEADPKLAARKLVEETLRTRIPSDEEIFNVRNVAPKKEMICVSFTLSKDLLRGSKISSTKRTRDELNLAEVKKLNIDDMDWDGNDTKKANDEIMTMKRPKLA